MNKLILIIEDEEKIAQLLVDYLQRDNFETKVLLEGSNAISTIRESKPDLILLDLMLPGKDGITICRELREFSDIPVIMTTARISDIDRILGLELGADDYICKPFNPHEVMARVKAVLRRSGQVAVNTDEQVSYQNLELNKSTFKAHYNNDLIELTAVEFRMLYLLAEQPGRVFTREQLMNNAYTDDRIVEDRTIDTHIKNLRRKLSVEPDSAELIHSVYGVGYRLE